MANQNRINKKELIKKTKEIIASNFNPNYPKKGGN